MSIEELIKANTAAVIENTEAVRSLIEAVKGAEDSRRAAVEQVSTAITTANAPKRASKKDAEAATPPASTAAAVSPPPPSPPPAVVETVSEEDAKQLLGTFVNDGKVPATMEERVAIARSLLAKSNGGSPAKLTELSEQGRTMFVKLLKAHIESAAQVASDDDLI